MPRILDPRRLMQSLVSSSPLVDWGRKGLLGSLGLGFDHVREVHDVRYGSAQAHTLDLFFPAGRAPASAMVFVHGGSWRSGHHAEYRFVGRALASRGHAVAVVGYRLFPEVCFPAFVHDVAEAVVFLERERARLGWPASPLWLCGHSAGAHIVCLAGMEPAFFAPFGHAPRIAGLISLSGPYSFVPERDPALFEVFGMRSAPQAWLPMCPLQCVGEGRPPLLALHGDADTIVLHAGAERMVQQCLAGGQAARLLTFAQAGHFQPLLAFHPRMPGHQRLMTAIDDFCRSGVP